MRQLLALALTLVTVSLVVLPGGAASATKAADFIGGGLWFNTEKPLTLADLRGRVVAVDMWTAGCYNCRNTFPYLRQWDAKYRAKGLVIVGVHTPEFDHERSPQYVKDALAKFNLKYPVVMDNDYRIWHAYHNEYWPTLYLIDKKGNIRYSHIGEGAYDEIDRTIAQLLAEPN